MAMGGGGSTYGSADGIWHAAIDIEPDRATGRRRRLTAQGKTKGGGEREAQDEAGRIRAQGLHAELAVAAPHGLARDLVPRAGRGQPASEQQAKLRERHRAAEQDSRREAHQLAGPQGHGRHSGRPEVLQPEDGHDHLVRPEERA